MTCVPAGRSVSVIEKGLSLSSVTWRSTRSLRFIGVSSLAVITGVNSDVVIAAGMSVALPESSKPSVVMSVHVSLEF